PRSTRCLRKFQATSRRPTMERSEHLAVYKTTVHSRHISSRLHCVVAASILSPRFRQEAGFTSDRPCCRRETEAVAQLGNWDERTRTGYRAGCEANGVDQRGLEAAAREPSHAAPDGQRETLSTGA